MENMSLSEKISYLLQLGALFGGNVCLQGEKKTYCLSFFTDIQFRCILYIFPSKVLLARVLDYALQLFFPLLTG